jgi:vacuolar protein sorting-associated protein 1
MADFRLIYPGIAGRVPGKHGLACYPQSSALTVIRCCRCPMEVRLSPGDSANTPWSCKISLRRDSSADGSPTACRPFGPPLTIDQKPQVELWLRRAQAAILSPHRHPEEFHQMGRDEIARRYDIDTMMKKFSRDLIVMEIVDPEGGGCLSFVDLPGKESFLLPDPLGLTLKSL